MNIEEAQMIQSKDRAEIRDEAKSAEQIKIEHKKAHEYFSKKTEDITQTVFVSFSDEINRIRRNLLIATSIALIYLLSDRVINPWAFIGGNENIKENFIDAILFIFILYHSIHFFLRFLAYRQQRQLEIKNKNEIIEQLKTLEALVPIETLESIESIERQEEEGKYEIKQAKISLENIEHLVRTGKLDSREASNSRHEPQQREMIGRQKVERAQEALAKRKMLEYKKALEYRENFSQYIIRLNNHTKSERSAFRIWFFIEVIMPLFLSFLMLSFLSPCALKWLMNAIGH